MPRYIDADNLQRHGKRGGVVYWRDIEAQPTADVVPMDFHERCMEIEIQMFSGGKEENMRKNITDYINYIEKEYGVYIDLDLIQDAFSLSEYMTIKIMASTAGGGKEVNYKFQTTTVTENYLKKKIMEVVKMLKGDNMIFVDPSLGSFSGMITVPTTFSMDYRRQIKKVIFNDPATIIFWEDGSKTVVKCQPDDKYDKMTGFAMACAKYMFGNEGNYYEVFKKWVGEEE